MRKAGYSIVIVAFVFLALSFTTNTKTNSPSTIDGAVEWLTIEEAITLAQKEPKKIFIDVYTVWCGWCKTMDKNTFQNPTIAKYLNENYYSVKFDAEYKEDIVFNGKTYKFIKNGRRGYHELAAELVRGRLSFPTTVFLDEEQRLIQPIPGYKDPEMFEQIISYFGEDMHKKMPWEKYQREFKKKKAQSTPKEPLEPLLIKH